MRLAAGRWSATTAAAVLIASRDVMDFLILGPLAVYDDGSEVRIKGLKQRQASGGAGGV